MYIYECVTLVRLEKIVSLLRLFGSGSDSRGFPCCCSLRNNLNPKNTKNPGDEKCKGLFMR